MPAETAAEKEARLAEEKALKESALSTNVPPSSHPSEDEAAKLAADEKLNEGRMDTFAPSEDFAPTGADSFGSTVEGGVYIVRGRRVNANGEPVKE